MNQIDLLGGIGFEVTLAGVLAQTQMFDQTQPLHVRINSDGGSVEEATGIYSVLSAWSGGCTVEILGWACSSASLIAMAGRPVRMNAAALMMIHAPWLRTEGNQHELRATADALASVEAAMSMAYMRGGRIDPATVKGWLDGKDHWFTAEEARAAGLVDEVIATAADATARTHAPINAVAMLPRVPHHLRTRIAAMTSAASQAQAHLQNSTLPPVDAAAVLLAADRQRRADIRASFMPFLGREGMRELAQQCEDDPRCDAAGAGQRILAQMARGAGPVAGGYVPEASGNGAPDGRLPDFLAAARDVLLMRAGVAVKEPHPATKDLRRMSVATMAERVLSMHGRSARDLSADQVIRAALTTSDFPNLLTGVGSKALLAGYDGAATTHAVWTGERETRDFKPTTLIALSESPALEEVAEAGEYKHGAMQEAAETFRIATFGKIVALSRQALVNDDLGAFTSLAQSLGAAARRLEADMVYGRLTANPVMGDGITLFHASHGNLAASGGALDLATLGAARAAMRKQKGVAGVAFLDPQPRFLIVPVTMETAAEALLRTLTDPSASANGAQVEWVRNLTLVADPRLDAVSTTAWYLACAPQQLETIARCYLQGEERPHLEEREGWERDVHEWKVRLDFAAAVIGWRGLYKNAGA